MANYICIGVSKAHVHIKTLHVRLSSVTMWVVMSSTIVTEANDHMYILEFGNTVLREHTQR